MPVNLRKVQSAAKIFNECRYAYHQEHHDQNPKQAHAPHHGTAKHTVWVHHDIYPLIVFNLALPIGKRDDLYILSARGQFLQNRAVRLRKQADAGSAHSPRPINGTSTGEPLISLIYGTHAGVAKSQLRIQGLILPYIATKLCIAMNRASFRQVFVLLLGILITLGMGLSVVQASIMNLQMVNMASEMTMSGSDNCSACGKLGDAKGMAACVASTCVAPSASLAAPVEGLNMTPRSVHDQLQGLALIGTGSEPSPYPPRTSHIG